MATIRPFKAIRPTRDKVHLVAARPFYSYKKNVLDAKLEDNPFTFLHIINPEFGSEKKTAPNSRERFERVSEQYARFIAAGILVQDEEPTMYIYRQTKNGHSFTGIICGASVAEYNENRIKKHEATLTSREEMFTKYLDIVGYNAEPVLLSYSPDHPKIDLLFGKCTQERPENEFTTTDLITHELWKLSAEDAEAFRIALGEIDYLYIADGHHRSASSARLSDLRKKRGSSFENEASFLAFIMNEKDLNILEFNRLVKTLNGLKEHEVIEKLSENFDVKSITGPQTPSEEHQFTMLLGEQWYALTCHPEIIHNDHPVRCLDAEILTEYVLQPIFGIQDLKSDKNIAFMSGAEPITTLEKRVASNEYAVAFVLYPATIEQIKRVADHQMTMPPKSTWVEPKLRSGLTIYNINE